MYIYNYRYSNGLESSAREWTVYACVCGAGRGGECAARCCQSIIIYVCMGRGGSWREIIMSTGAQGGNGLGAGQ